MLYTLQILCVAGYLQLLKQLTKVGEVSQEQFEGKSFLFSGIALYHAHMHIMYLGIKL